MLNPLSGANALLKMGGAIPASVTSVASESINSMKGVVDKLSSSLMSGGHLNTDSPLGKMVEQQLKKENPFMALAGGKGGEENAVKKALGDLIKDKLGSNFGASADAGIGGKGQGGQDLMSQTLQGLGKSSLDNALKDKGDGSTFDKADKPILQQVANFMDQNKAEFGAPDSGSWSKELDEGGGKDNFLDKGETSKFRAALEQISQQMGAGDGASGAQGAQSSQGNGGLGSLQQEPSANDSSSTGEKPNDLAQLLGSSNPMDIFKQGLEMGLGIASGKGAEGGANQQSGLSPQLQQHSLQSSAAEAAQNIRDVMSAGLS